ncbi:TPA: hypothetical protein ACG7AA_000190 [Streptococcus agalactiae]
MQIGFYKMNIRDEVIIVTKKNQKFQGVIYAIEENNYYVALDYKKGKITTSKVILHDSEIESFKIIEHHAIRRGENPMK